MKLSVVIPCYNAAKTIGEQLEALSHQEWDKPWEVVVVDNCCSDNSMQIVAQYDTKIPSISIVKAYNKKCVGYARNKGVKKANGEYLVFCDGDDVVAEDWLASMGEALLKHDFVACRMNWSKLNDFSEHTLQAKVQTNKLIDFSMVKFLPYGGGGTLGIKKSIHEEVGEFDENLDRLQDLDYCWRVQLKGYKLVFVPEAVIYIRARDTDYKILRQELKWAEYDVYLHEKYKHHGIPKFTVKQNLKSLYHVLLAWRDMFKEEKRRLWVVRLGLQVGRLKGMIKYKYLNIEL